MQMAFFKCFHTYCCIFLISCPTFIFGIYTLNSVVGSLKCDGENVPDVKVSLHESGIIYNSHIQETVSETNGKFSMHLNENWTMSDKIFVRVKYVYEKGEHRTFYVVNDFKTPRSEDFFALASSADLDAQGNLNYGTFNLESAHCSIFLLTRRSMMEFEEEAETTHPAEVLYVISESSTTVGIPYATTDTIRIPKGMRSNIDTMRHELAHTVRHSLDGGFFHFLLDVAAYTYAQRHWCDKKTNEAFAFNEGWAAFWMKLYTCSAARVEDGQYDFEGNVDNGLRALTEKCHAGKGKKEFVAILKDNPGAVHTFPEFLQLHNAKYSCTL